MISPIGTMAMYCPAISSRPRSPLEVRRPGAAGATRCLAGTLLVVACLAGCGSGEKMGRVFGKVTFQNQPVPEGVISFSNAEKGVYMTAKLNPDGTYEVVMAQGRGLPLGTYQVAINPPLVDAPLGPALEPPKLQPYPNIPERYRKPEQSGLTLTVQEGDNPFNVDMQP